MSVKQPNGPQFTGKNVNVALKCDAQDCNKPRMSGVALCPECLGKCKEANAARIERRR